MKIHLCLSGLIKFMVTTANLWILSICVFTMWIYSGTLEVGALKSGSDPGDLSKIFSL